MSLSQVEVFCCTQATGMVVMKMLQASLSLSLSLSLSPYKLLYFSLSIYSLRKPAQSVFFSSEIYHVLIATNFLVNGMDRRPERFIGNYTGGESLTIRATCRGDRCMCPRRRRVAFHFIRRTFVEKFERHVKEGSGHERSPLGNLEEVSLPRLLRDR
jgi:hypothetical protein